MNRIFKNIKNITSTLMVTLLSFGALAIPVMAEDNVVDTTPVEGIIVTNPNTDSNNATNSTNTDSNTSSADSSSSSSLDNDGLKEDLYDGDVLKQSDYSVDNFFARLTKKLKGLVNSIKQPIIPFLVITWLILFVVAILRVLTGERGASSTLLRALLIVTIAYVGVVAAEPILASLVKFLVGA